MKTIKVYEATNIQLDWLVAMCEKKRVSYFGAGPMAYLAYIPKRSAYRKWCPTTNPIQMWPIIERERMHIYAGPQWTASVRPGQFVYGPTSLIAAARCYVLSKLGEEVKVPKELT